MVNECQVHPYFMVAALIFFTKTPGMVGDRKSTVQSYFPPFMRVRWLEKSAPGTTPGLHNGVGPGGIGKSVGKGFFNDTGRFSIVAACAAGVVCDS